MRYWSPCYSYTLRRIPIVEQAEIYQNSCFFMKMDDNLPIGIRYINLSYSMLQLRDSIESQSVLNKLFKTHDLLWFLQKFTKEKHLKKSI